MITLVSGGHNTRPCPFSGRYSLNGVSMSALMSGQLNCNQAIMHAGCSASDDLIVESACSKNLEDNVRTLWACHGRWNENNKQMLVLSTPIMGEEPGASNFVCLSYTEREGILTATASMNSCQNSAYGGLQNMGFNISSSGPCLQALTSGGNATAVVGPYVTMKALFVLLILKIVIA
jgi:hypothetical protein